MSEEEIKECLDSLYYQDDVCSISYDKLKDYIIKLKIQLQQKENIINELKERSLRYSKQIDGLLEIKEEIREKIENVQILGLRSGKTLIATLLNEISEILDKEVNRL